MQTSESITNIAKALKEVQNVLRPAKMDSDNPFFHSKYASLSSCWDAIREPLYKNGLSIVQTSENDADNKEKICITTMLLHESGEWIKFAISILPQDQKPQTIGSCITYLRRYHLSVVGLVIETDTDGNLASPQTRPPVKPRPGPPPAEKKPATYTDETVLDNALKTKLLTDCNNELKTRNMLSWEKFTDVENFARAWSIWKEDQPFTVLIAKQVMDLMRKGETYDISK